MFYEIRFLTMLFRLTGQHPSFSPSAAGYTVRSLPREDEVPGHPVVLVGGNYKQRECRYCRFHGNRTKSGWRVKTNYKCAICQIPLCTKESTGRNCFTNYHQEFVFGDQQPDARVQTMVKKYYQNIHVRKFIV